MDKKYILAIIAIFLVAVYFIVNLMIQSANDTKNTKIVTLAGKEIKAELADEPFEQARGLMFRKKLAADEGMLFIFPDEQYRTFWMKNTLIPLDLLFLDGNLKIIDIKESFQPCQQDPCPVYTSQMPARYVLEVNAGFTEMNRVMIGEQVSISE